MSLVGLFRRGPRTPKAPRKVTLPPPVFPEPEPITFEAALREGLMLTEYASRMELKNRIVVGVLTEGSRFNPRRYLPDARAAIDRLVSESIRASERLAEERRQVVSVYGKAVHAHDYRYADAVNLRRREKIARALVEKMGERRNDNSYLISLIERAREDAAQDILGAVEDSLERANVPVDDVYLREREGRMQMLIVEDLAALERERHDPHS